MYKGVLYLFFTFCSFSIVAQKSFQPTFTQKKLNKYPNERLGNIIFDEKGVLWGSSGVNLIRDDGTRVQKIEIDYDFEDDDNQIINIFYDNKKGIFIFSYISESLVGVLDKNTLQYEIYKDTVLAKEEFSSTITTVKYSKNEYFMANYGGGLSIFNSETKKFRHFLKENSDIPSNIVKGLVRLQDGRFLIGFFDERNKKAGLHYFDPADETFTPFPIEDYYNSEKERFNYIAKRSLKIVHFLHEDILGNIWVGSYSGFFKIDVKNKTIQRFTGQMYNETEQNMDNCLAYNIDEKGYFWVSTYNNGIMIVNPTTSVTKYIKHDPQSKISLGSNFVSRLRKDPFDNIWVSYRNKKSVGVYSPKQHTFDIHPWKEMDLDFNNRSNQTIPVNQITVTNNGKVLISSGNGLHLYDPEHKTQEKIIGSFEKILNDNSVNRNFPHFNYINNKVCFSANRSIYVYDLISKTTKIIDNLGSIYHSPVFTHEVVEENAVYFYHRSLLHKVDLKKLTGNFEHNFKDTEFSTFVTSKARKLNSGKWLAAGHKKRHIFIINPDKNYEIETYDNKDSVNFYPDSSYNAAFVDGDTVWIGTDKGLYLFKESEGTFESYNEQIGIKEASVKSLIKDSNGDLWIAVEEDLIRFNPSKMNTQRFNEDFGLFSGGFLPAVAQKDGAGNIYIASINGIVTFNPNNIKKTDDPFTLNLSSLAVNKDTFLIYSEATKSQIPKSFSWDENSFVFSFKTNQIYSPHPHEYHYRIIGLDSTWNNNGTSPVIRFPDLNHGDYQLEVKAVNAYNVESNVFTYSFTIQRPFWLTWWFIVLVVMFLAIIVWLFIKKREKKILKQKKLLEDTVEIRTKEVVDKANKITEQKDIIEEKNKEIVDSINYAKRIQSAYLPPEDTFYKVFKDAFLYFAPKDVVSGDFYWFYTMNNEKGEKEIFVAAADCTGHGVPGALMSVICCNALNETVITQKIHDPGEILNNTRDIVKKNLKSNINKQYKDGMDISFCKININQRKVSFAGANNPLWIVTENHHFKLEDGKSKTYEDSPLTLWEVKADKQPIGLYDHEKPFTTHIFQLSEGDRIYMFSDGFQDQFGGEDISETKKGGKKFKSANFKKLLLSYYDKSMSHQKTSLESTFEKWKGDLEQIDDVCVIGVRL